MTVYKKEQLQNEKLPDPPPGEHVFRVAYEKPSERSDAIHSILLKNDQYQIWYSCFLSRLEEFAHACGVNLNQDGSLDVSRLKGKLVKVTTETSNTKSGTPFMKIVHVEQAERQMEIPNIPSSSIDEDIPF